MQKETRKTVLSGHQQPLPNGCALGLWDSGAPVDCWPQRRQHLSFIPFLFYQWHQWNTKPTHWQLCKIVFYTYQTNHLVYSGAAVCCLCQPCQRLLSSLPVTWETVLWLWLTVTVSIRILTKQLETLNCHEYSQFWLTTRMCLKYVAIFLLHVFKAEPKSKVVSYNN